jgi:hypothetical protein
MDAQNHDFYKGEKSNDSKQKVVGIVVHVSGVTQCL